MLITEIFIHTFRIPGLLSPFKQYSDEYKHYCPGLLNTMGSTQTEQFITFTYTHTQHFYFELKIIKPCYL
jgi:hypothetical protein